MLIIARSADVRLRDAKVVRESSNHGAVPITELRCSAYETL
jgi:hypothetical protein